MAIKRLILGLILLISLNGYSQSLYNLTVRNDLTVDNYVEVDGTIQLNDSTVTDWYSGVLVNTDFVSRSISDSISEYSFVTLGTEGQIPFTNGTGTDFDYDANFTWNDKTLTVNYGTNNVFIGEDAGSTMGATGSNVFIGKDAGKLNTQNSSTFIGVFSGQNNNGFSNVFVGYNAGRFGTTGSRNVFLGQDAGSSVTGSDNVLIGYQSAQSQTAISNKLYIENSNSSTPLIYGEFDNDLVKINGYLDADSSVFELQNISAGLNAAKDITLADTWQTLKYDTAYSDVTTDSLIFNSDSTGIESRINGYLQFNGHVSLMNQTAGNVTATVYLRLLINDVESSRFNTVKSRTYAAGGSDDLTSHGGIIKVNKGDIIKVQIRSTSTDININSPDGAVFTNVTPFSISLVEKILNK